MSTDTTGSTPETGGSVFTNFFSFLMTNKTSLAIGTTALAVLAGFYLWKKYYGNEKKKPNFESPVKLFAGKASGDIRVTTVQPTDQSANLPSLTSPAKNPSGTFAYPPKNSEDDFVVVSSPAFAEPAKS